jgi:hypothetical protein
MAMMEWFEDGSATAASIEKFIQDELQNMDKNFAATKPVALRSFADICQIDYEPLQWIVEGVIPEGVTLLFAPPKKGKSILATHLVDAVSGGMAFEGIPVKRRGALYLALEDHGRRIKRPLAPAGKRSAGQCLLCNAERLGKSESALGNILKALKNKDIVCNPFHGIWALSQFHINSHMKTCEEGGKTENGNSHFHISLGAYENVNLPDLCAKAKPRLLLYWGL